MDILVHFLVLLQCIVVRGFLMDHIPDGVHTSMGDIQGRIVDFTFDGVPYKGRKFLGIPYAKPPVGDLRFRKPEMLTTFGTASPFMATKHGSICPQLFAELYGLTVSEDCLFVNVYTPYSSDYSRLVPVMVWIHGGGFSYGFSDAIDGSVLSASSNVVVVTFNYRIGPLGFYSSHDSKASGNYGLWDQHLAFQWVKNNIAAFGGDPYAITIFGESAGSSSVVYQSMYAGNRGLFQRAIAESGTIAGWGIDIMHDNYDESIRFAESLGCNGSSSAERVNCLRSLTSDEIVKATRSIQLPGLPFPIVNRPWSPIFDHDFVVFPTSDLLKHVEKNPDPKFQFFLDIDFMIGANYYDGLIYFENFFRELNVSVNDNGEYPATQETLGYVVSKIAPAFLGEQPSKTVVDMITREYTPISNPANQTLLQEAIINITTDTVLWAPSLLTARAHTFGTGSTYMYRFSVAPSKSFFQAPPSLQTEYSASHSDEIDYLFGFPDSWMSPINQTIADATPEMIKVAKSVMQMWTNFAKTGYGLFTWHIIAVEHQRKVIFKRFKLDGCFRKQKQSCLPPYVTGWNQTFFCRGG